MINYDLFKEIELYASRHVESSAEYYKSRNQSTDKLFKHCFDGKIAEFMCFISMKKAGYILDKPPCMQIFSQGNKSYDSDLLCIGKNNEIYETPKHIHVKAISIKTYETIGISALIQKNDPIYLNPLRNHYFSFMLQVNLTHYEFCKWICSTDVIYGEPRAKHLAATKRAIYL